MQEFALSPTPFDGAVNCTLLKPCKIAPGFRMEPTPMYPTSLMSSISRSRAIPTGEYKTCMKQLTTMPRPSRLHEGEVVSSLGDASSAQPSWSTSDHSLLQGNRWPNALLVVTQPFVQPLFLFWLINSTVQDGLVRIRFVLGTAPSHVSIPPNRNGTMAKGG